MSEYTVCDIQIKDSEALKEALRGLGVPDEHIEEHQIAQSLHGFGGDIRDQKAHIIIRRQHVGRASNDIGFEKQADGTYKAWVSQFDRNRRLGQRIVNGELVQGYAKRMVEKQIAKTRGWKMVSQERDKAGKMRIKISVR